MICYHKNSPLANYVYAIWKDPSHHNLVCALVYRWPACNLIWSWLSIPLMFQQFEGHNAPDLSASVQHVRNAGVVIQCDECNKWWLTLSKWKLSSKENHQIQGIVQDLSYSCGITLHDLVLLSYLYLLWKLRWTNTVNKLGPFCPI
jgi:hypothetical protein